MFYILCHNIKKLKPTQKKQLLNVAHIVRLEKVCFFKIPISKDIKVLTQLKYVENGIYKHEV